MVVVDLVLLLELQCPLAVLHRPLPWVLMLPALFSLSWHLESPSVRAQCLVGRILQAAANSSTPLLLATEMHSCVLRPQLVDTL